MADGFSGLRQKQMQSGERAIALFRLSAFSILLMLYLVFSQAGSFLRARDLLLMLAWLLLALYSLPVLQRVRDGRISAGLCHFSAAVDALGATVFLVAFQAAFAEEQTAFLVTFCRHLYYLLLILSLLRLSPLNTMIAGAGSVLGAVAALLLSILSGREIFHQTLYLPAYLAMMGATLWIICRWFADLLTRNMVSEEVQRAGRRLRMTLDIIHASVSNLNQFVDPLARISYTLLSGAREQAKNIEYVSATAGSLQSSMARITESTEVSARTIGRTVDFSESGNSIVHRVIAEILGIHEVVDQMVASLELIDDLSDQTSLLALNAAIEASQVGQEGSGFAVIADEIRKLAEKSAQTAGEIGKMAKKVEQAIFSGGESSKEAGKIFDRINKDLGGYSSFTQELHRSVQKLLETSREINRSIENVGQVIHDNNQAADLVKKLIGKMKKEVTQMKILLDGKAMEMETANAEEAQA